MNIIEATLDYNEQVLHMNFDSSCLGGGCGVNVVLYFPFRKLQHFTYQLYFPCIYNVSEVESLILELEAIEKLICECLTIFGDSKLIMNIGELKLLSLVILKQYTQLIWDYIDNVLSFNCIYI